MRAFGAADGIILTGSAARGTQTSASDLDLVILLRRNVPEFLVSTRIGGRLADVIVAASACLKRVGGRHPPTVDSFASWMAGWLRNGKILHDPRGLVGRATARMRRRVQHARPGFDRLYPEWFQLNNNLRHNAIMTRSGDPVYRTALRIRLLYSTMEALLAYFRLRGMPWPGEKEAVRHLRRHDPRMLTGLLRALGVRSQSSSFRSYERLVNLASTRRWPRLRPSATAFQLLDGKPPTRARITLCRKVWHRLLQPRPVS